MNVLQRIAVVCLAGLVTACASSSPGTGGNASVERVPVSLPTDTGIVTGALVVSVYMPTAASAAAPAASGKHPLVVINHGRGATAADRAKMSRTQYPQAVKYFTDAGFLVAVPIRLGYGETGGPDLEDSGACGDRQFTPMFDRVASQIGQVVKALQQRPDVDASNVLLLGQSLGGGAVIALAAQNPPGVRTAINFAGGAGGNANSPGQPCGPDRMQQTFAGYGKTSRLPTLWIYAQNDLFWGADWPKRWVDAYNAAGGNATFVAMGADGNNGHLLFPRSPQKWQPVVAEYLRGLGYAMPQ